MANLFYTLFKYKEKAQKDELGNYPEKVNVRAFPERRYLWTSRFLVVISCISICLSMMLGSAIILMLPNKETKMVPLQVDYNRYVVTRMEQEGTTAFAGDLVTEDILHNYIVKRYTIGDDLDELLFRFSEKEFFYLTSSDNVYQEFLRTEKPYMEMLYKQGVRRKVVPINIYPVSFDFWQVYFYTIDSAEGRLALDVLRLMGLKSEDSVFENAESDVLINYWRASIRMNFNFSKYENKEEGLKNPFGLTVLTYNLSYMGNSLRSRRSR